MGDIITDSAQLSTQRLVAWIHACGATLAEKLHGLATVHEGTEEFTNDPDWVIHQRCETNTGLDGVSRGLVFQARLDPDEIRLQKVWATRVLLNKRDLLNKVETFYVEKGLRGLYEGNLNEQILCDALDNAGPLDNAYARMRQQQWKGEMLVRGQKGRFRQKPLFAATWARLRQEGAFAKACVVVGGGALSTLQACTVATGKSDNERLADLNARLLELLDPVLLQLVVPQGWTKDLTEHACCELSRWDKARRHRLRKTVGNTQRQQQRMQELRATWQLLGFDAEPYCATAQNAMVGSEEKCSVIVRPVVDINKKK